MSPYINDVLAEIDRAESFLPFATHLVPAVSDWTVGQQIEHAAKATSAFAVTLLRNKGPVEAKADHPWKMALLENGSFPRGMVDAPDITLPAPQTSSTALQNLLRKTRIRVGNLAELPPDATADHHYLGTMQRDEAIRFMAIHLRHHISIMGDIVKASSVGPST